MTEPEAEAIVAMLEGCEDPPEVESLDLLEARTGEHKPALESSVFGSRQEAEDAGGSDFRGAKATGESARRPWCRAPMTGTAMAMAMV